jgi:DNA polymerase III subunit gamma/tau
MGQALYRKYRSKKLSEIVGQEHITTTLKNALKKGAISHAYLFTGPRGVGKTSIARILAHEVNQLPYDESATHLDIIEIDAASNRRIDEIRTLRERVHNAPASAKYKVYIIDEVHMLTREAFNALLKTLEEPPAHAIFILATTEAHKLPETIVSRTQRYTFKPVAADKAVEHLRYIANEEKIDISDEALELIAEHGGGSFRDSISLLDQLSSGGVVVDLAAAQKALGIAPHEAIAQIVQIMQTGNTAGLLDTLRNLHEQGYQASQIAKQLAKHIRSSLMEGKPSFEPTTLSLLLKRLIDVPASHDPMALLEIILLETTFAGTPQNNIVVQPPHQTAPAEKPEPKPKKTPPKVSPPEEESLPKPAAKDSPLDESTWQQVLQILKQKHNTLYGVARMATPLFKDDGLTLVFGFPFHQKRLNDAKNKQIVADIISAQTGKDIKISCIVEAKPKTSPAEKKPERDIPPPADPLKTISNIFGDAEVLE